MDTPRHDCYTAVLPDNKLMVVGGQTEQGVTDIVEIASLIVKLNWYTDLLTYLYCHYKYVCGH